MLAASDQKLDRGKAWDVPIFAESAVVRTENSIKMEQDISQDRMTVEQKRNVFSSFVPTVHTTFQVARVCYSTPKQESNYIVKALLSSYTYKWY